MGEEKREKTEGNPYSKVRWKLYGSLSLGGWRGKIRANACPK
jgi:hypothetical protein